jgi:small subunit ribosomal protein S8
MTSDNLSLLFSNINLASVSRQKSITVKTSKKIIKVLNVFYKEGLIRGYAYNFKITRIFIKYSGSEYRPTIKYIKKISTPRRFFFVNVKTLSKLNLAGQFFLLSTIEGLVTSTKALSRNIGGKVLCKILI